MNLITTMAAAIILTALPLSATIARADGEAALPGTSVQLYSVRDALGEDFKGTLTQIAGMGFDAVEFAGVFGPYENDPEGLKAFLDGLGLQVSAAHVSFEKLNDDNFAATTNFYQRLGTDTLIVPWDERAWSPDGVEWVAATLTALSGKLAPLGLRTGWHNHDKEFDAYMGTTYWDYIADNTPPEVVLQQDVGWTRIAGKDAAAYVRKHPGRTLTTHIKAKIPEGVDAKPLIGQDDYDWPAVITALLEAGGTQWFVVEQEDYPDGMTSLEAVKVSKDGFDAYLADFR
jgi:sugar phosphate isomerase/epimerase